MVKVHFYSLSRKYRLASFYLHENHLRIPITPKAWISSRRSLAYHQHEVLNIIKPQENARWRVMRYKGGLPPLMIYAALRASMICQACGLDKKIPKTVAFGILLARIDEIDACHSISVISISGNNLSCFLSTPAYFPIKATSN